MKYNLNLIEYPNIIGVVSSEFGALFSQANRLMIASDENVEVLFNAKTRFGYGVVKNGVWLSFNNESYFYDLERRSLTDVKETDIRYSSARVLNNFVAGNYLYNGEEDVLFCKHLDTCEIYKNGEVDVVEADNENIFTYNMFEGMFTCYDKFLEKVWSYKTNKALPWMYFPKYYLYNDSVIINGAVEDVKVGAAGYERCNFELIALHKNTGEIKWSTLFEVPPTYSVLIADKFYLYRNNNVIIVDAKNGDVLLEENVGFSSNYPNSSEKEKVGIFQHNNHIFVFGLWNESVRVFDINMQLIQEIEFPKPYTKHCFGKISGSPYSFSVHNNIVYCCLNYYTGLGALAMLSPAEDDVPKITVQKRPNFIHEEIPEEVGHAYKLSLDSNNPDEVVSAGEFELMEIAQYCGADRSEHDHFDPELNDHLIYSVNKSMLPYDAEKDLKLMAERVEKFCKNFLVKSAKTGNNFKIEIELR